MNPTLRSVDHELIALERLRNGDERLLNELYQLYFKKLLHFGKQHLNDEFAVTNIIHEAFIKAWEFRKTMKSVEHFYFFIRMNMKWHFIKYYGDNRYRFYRSTFLTEHPEEQFADIQLSETEIEERKITEQRFEAIYKVIPLLPMKKSNVMLLHYKYGLSYKAIARRVGSTNIKVIAELEKAVKSIRAMLLVKSIKANSETVKSTTPAATIREAGMELSGEAIVTLRKKEQLSFDEIARRYTVDKAEILKLYLETIKEANAS